MRHSWKRFQRLNVKRAFARDFVPHLFRTKWWEIFVSSHRSTFRRFAFFVVIRIIIKYAIVESFTKSNLWHRVPRLYNFPLVFDICFKYFGFKYTRDLRILFASIRIVKILIWIFFRISLISLIFIGDYGIYSLLNHRIPAVSDFFLFIRTDI